MLFSREEAYRRNLQQVRRFDDACQGARKKAGMGDRSGQSFTRSPPLFFGLHDLQAWQKSATSIRRLMRPAWPRTSAHIRQSASLEAYPLPQLLKDEIRYWL